MTEQEIKSRISEILTSDKAGLNLYRCQNQVGTEENGIPEDVKVMNFSTYGVQERFDIEVRVKAVLNNG